MNIEIHVFIETDEKWFFPRCIIILTSLLGGSALYKRTASPVLRGVLHELPSMIACSVTWVAVVSQSRDKAQLGAALTKAHLEGLGLRFLDTQRIALRCHWLSGITWYDIDSRRSVAISIGSPGFVSAATDKVTSIL
ncbi:hypothetical protein CDAR_397871 [Caerostris darwini]|uniref:Uncharacterized protein n=1 Tax=Caerostris darwini TaxID=1538125 RepID=A0AAV4MMY1_9ARAC|nr:hypothetical protein CDAR_397871 [Caerostris darwini]